MLLPDEVMTRLQQWQHTHPQATFTEIETEVARLVAHLHAALVQTTIAQQAPPDPPPCDHCGQPMQAAGQRTRHVQTRTGIPVVLTRRYYVCPACDAGLFPTHPPVPHAS